MTDLQRTREVGPREKAKACALATLHEEGYVVTRLERLAEQGRRKDAGAGDQM
jgi:hypothetical protein